MQKTKSIVGLFLLAFPAFSQTTPDDAIRSALQNHPSVRAAAFEVQAKKYNEKAALNLPNPEVNAESPTGEFYAVGVQQAFEFPTVYARQKQVAKAETALAQASRMVSENDLRYAVRSLYLEAQVAEYQARQWVDRDSVYHQIAAAAIRQFAAGEVDFLQKTRTENEAGRVHQERMAAERLAETLRQQLATYAGLTNLTDLLPLRPDTSGFALQPLAQTSPDVAYSQQAVQVAETQVRLAKSKVLPNFSVGYLNQGARNTPTDYRFRASIGLPLWAGQYRAGANAAKAETQAAIARAEAQTQAVALEWQRVQSDLTTALAKVQYQEQEALPRSRALIAAAVRMREAGQVDYITLLRTLDEAFAIQQEYAEQALDLNRAQLRLRHLSGN
ncbi:MAG: TolC family protein [Saprospiraceae bacterium]